MALNVHYSVGQNASDHKTGSPTITIASGVATFSTAQVAVNLGVGDRVTHAGGDLICYLASKVSTTVWNVVTALGASPTNVTTQTVTSIAHEYTSIDAASAGAKDANHINNASLVAADVVLNIPCYFDSGPDTQRAVISGWTTSATQFIRIYTPFDTATECNKSQRHEGIYDESFFHMKSSNNELIQITSEDVKIDGLQIYETNLNTAFYNPIEASGAYVYNIEISNNILRQTPGTANNRHGMYLVGNSGSVHRAWNNIIYDGYTTSFNGSGIQVGGSGVTGYVYNNTVINFKDGIRRTSGTVVVKNNIVQDCDDDYQGTFDGTSTNNLDEDGSAPGANSVTATLTFVDKASDNYKILATSDALDAGADLSADGNIAFDDDCFRKARTYHFDMGALQATLELFRSVGATITDLNVATAKTVTITGSTAVFSGDMPDNIGVGDVLQYQVAATYYVAFIVGRTSATTFTVKDRFGLVPQSAVATTVVSVYRVWQYLRYTDNDDAADVNSNIHADVDQDCLWPDTDFPVSNTIAQIACYADGDDTSTNSEFLKGAYVTDAEHYMRIFTPVDSTQVGTSQRHDGTPGGGGYDHPSGRIYTNYNAMRIEGIIANRYQLASDNALTSDNRIHSCISVNAGGTAGFNIGGGIANVRNCIAISATGHGFFCTNNNSVPTPTFYNCTSVGAGDDGFNEGGASTMVATNCYAGGSVNQDFDGVTTMLDCASSDATGSAGLQTIPYSTATFVNVTGGTEDLNLVTGSGLLDVGTDLSAIGDNQFAVDIIGTSRPQNAVWDIGAFEMISGLTRLFVAHVG